MFETRLNWAIKIVSITAVLVILWDNPIVVPLRVLVTLLHEIFHANAVFLTGGEVYSIEITLYKTGLTSLHGGIPIFVYSAGYVGTALLGSILIVSTHRYPFKRPLFLVIGSLLLVDTILFVRSPFGWAYSLMVAVFFLILSIKDFKFTKFITELLGVTCIVDSFRDLISFYWRRYGNDATLLCELTGLPYEFVVTTWIMVSIIFVGLSIAFTFKSISSVNIEDEVCMNRPVFLRRFIQKHKVAMRKKQADSFKRRRRITLAVYFSVVAVIVLSILISSRYILFHPWTAREWVSAAVVNEYIYVVGGRDKAGQIYDQIHRISAKERRIKEVARLPSPRFGVGTVSLGEELYIIGGFDGKRCYDDILVFETRSKKFRIAGNLSEPRAFGGVSLVNGKIYYLGGWSGEEQTDKIHVIDPKTGSVTYIGRLPTPREFVSAAEIGNWIYLFGGSDDQGQYLDDVLEIDPNNAGILRTANLPTPRTRIAAASHNSLIYLAGGWDGNKIDEILVVNTSPRELSIQKICTLSQGYSDTALVIQDGILYLIGGTHEQFQRQLGVITIDPESGESKNLKFRNFLYW